MLGAQPDPKLEPSNYRSPHLQSTVPKPVATRKPLSKYHLLRPYFEDNYSVEGSSHIALEIERCIKQTRNFQKETPTFVNLIRSRIIYLLQYNLFVTSIALLYPLSNSFVQLLLRYVSLECKVLYKKEFYTQQYENEVQQRIYRLLMNVYYAYFESRLVPSSRIYKECSKSIISLFIKLKTDYGVSNKLMENIIVGLLRRTGDLDKVIALKGTRQPCSSDSYLDNANLVNVCRDVITSDYGSDEYLYGTSTHNDVQLCNVDDWDRNSRNSSTRVVPTICIDDDDVETVYFERECKPSERTIRKLAEKTSREAKVDRVFSLHKPLVENVAVIKNENKKDDVCEKPYTSYKTSVENNVQRSDEVVVIDDGNHSYTVNGNVAQVSDISNSDQAYSSPYLRSAPIMGSKTSNIAQLQKRQSIKVEEVDATDKLDRQYRTEDAIVNFQPKCEVVNTYDIDLTVDDDDDDFIEFFRVEEVIPKAEVNDSVTTHPDQSFKDVAVTSIAEKSGNEDDDVKPVPSLSNHCEIDLTEEDDEIEVSLIDKTSPGTSNTKEVNIETNQSDGVGGEKDVFGAKEDMYLPQQSKGVTMLPVTTLSEDSSSTITAPSSSYKVNAVEGTRGSINDNIEGRAAKSGLLCVISTADSQIDVLEKLGVIPDKKDAVVEEKGTSAVLEEKRETYLLQKSSDLEKSSGTTEISSINYQLNTAEDIVKEGRVIINKIGGGATKEPSSLHKCNEQEISDLVMKNNYNTTSPSTNRKDKDACCLTKPKGVITAGVELEETSNKTEIAAKNYNVNTAEDVVREAKGNIEEVVAKEPSGIQECKQQEVINLGLKKYCSSTSTSRNEGDKKEVICFNEKSVDTSSKTNVASDDSQIDITEEVRTVPNKKVVDVGEKEASGVLEEQVDTNPLQQSKEVTNLTLTRMDEESDKNSSTIEFSSNNTAGDIVEDARIIGNKGDDIEGEASVQEEVFNFGVKNDCSNTISSKNEGDKVMHCPKKPKEVICLMKESVDTSNTTNVSSADSQFEIAEEVRTVPNKKLVDVGEKDASGVLEEQVDTNPLQKSKEVTNLTVTTGLDEESDKNSCTREVSSNNHQVSPAGDIVEEARIIGNKEDDIDDEASVQEEVFNFGMKKYCSNTISSKIEGDKVMHCPKKPKEVICLIQENVDTSNTTIVSSSDSQFEITEEVRTVPNKKVVDVGDKEASGVLEEQVDTYPLQKSKEVTDLTVTTGLDEESDKISSTREVSSNNHQVSTAGDIVEGARIIGNKEDDIDAEARVQEELFNFGMKKDCSTTSSSKNEYDKDMHCSKKSEEVICVIGESVDTSYTTNVSSADSQIDVTDIHEEVGAVPNERDVVVGEKEAIGVLEGIGDADSLQKSKKVENFALTTGLVEESEQMSSTREVSSNNHQANTAEDIDNKQDGVEGGAGVQGCEQQEVRTSSSESEDDMHCLKVASNENDVGVGEKKWSGSLQQNEETHFPEKSKNITNLPVVKELGGQVDIVEGNVEDIRVDINKKDDKIECRLPKDLPGLQDCKNRIVDSEMETNTNSSTVPAPIVPKESGGDTDLLMATRHVTETEDVSKSTEVFCSTFQVDTSKVIAEEARVNVNRKDDIVEGMSAKMSFDVKECKQKETVDFKMGNDCNTTTVSTIPKDKDTCSAEFQVNTTDILEEVRVNRCKKDELVEEKGEPVKLLSLKEFPPNEFEVDSTKHVVEELEVDINKIVVIGASREEGATCSQSETGYNLYKCSEESTDFSLEIGTATKSVETSSIPESSSIGVHREFDPYAKVGESDSPTTISDSVKSVETSNVEEIAFDDLQIDVIEEIVEVVASDALKVAEEVGDKTMTLSSDVYFTPTAAEVASIKHSISGKIEVLPLGNIVHTIDNNSKLKKAETVICKELVVKLEQLKVLPMKNLDGSRIVQTKCDQIRSADFEECEGIENSALQISNTNENEDIVGIDDNIVVRGFQNLLNEIKDDEPSPVVEDCSEIVGNESRDSVITRFEDIANDEAVANKVEIFEKRDAIEDEFGCTARSVGEVFHVYDEDTLEESFEWCYNIKIQAPDCVANTRHKQSRDFRKTSTSECSGEAVFRPFRTMAERKEYYRLNPEFLSESCSDSQKRDARSKSLDGNSISIQKLVDIKETPVTLEVGGTSEAVDNLLDLYSEDTNILLPEENGRLEVPKSPSPTIRMHNVVSKTNLPELERKKSIDNTEYSEKSVSNEDNSILKLDEKPLREMLPRTFSSENQYQSNQKLTETKTCVTSSTSKSKIELPSDHGRSKSSRTVSENRFKKSDPQEDMKSGNNVTSYVSKKSSGVKTNEKTSKSRASSVTSEESSSCDASKRQTCDRSHKSRSRSSDKERKPRSKFENEVTTTKNTTSKNDTNMAEEVGCGDVKIYKQPVNELEDKTVKSRREGTIFVGLESGNGATLESPHSKNGPNDRTESKKSTPDKISSGPSPQHASSAIAGSVDISRRLETLKHGIELIKRRSHSKKSSRSRSRSSDRRSNLKSECKREKNHSKSKHDKTLSEETKSVKHRSEKAGGDDRDVSLRGHKDKKHVSGQARDSVLKVKDGVGNPSKREKQFVEDDKGTKNQRNIDSKAKSHLLRESKPNPIDRNPDAIEALSSENLDSNVNIARDLTVKVEMPTTISTTATSRSQLGTTQVKTKGISDVGASDVFVEENNKMERVDSHEPKPDDMIAKERGWKPNTTCLEREINILIVPPEVKVLEDRSDNSKSPKLISKQDSVDSLVVTKVKSVDLEGEYGESIYKDVKGGKVSDPNTTYEEECSSKLPLKQNVVDYIDPTVNSEVPIVTKLSPPASSKELCRTDLKTQEVGNEFNISNDTCDDRETQSPVLVVEKGEEKLQLAPKATKGICEISVLDKEAEGGVRKRKTCSSDPSIENSLLTDGMSVTTAHENQTLRQKTDETRSKNAIPTDVMEEKGIMSKSRTADTNLDKSRLAVSSGAPIMPVSTTSQLDSSSYVENCDEKCPENPESSRLELDCQDGQDCSLNTSTGENGTSSDKVDKQNDRNRKRKMGTNDPTTVKRIKPGGERVSGRKMETSMESIINEMKENVSIFQSEDIDVSAMKRKLSEKIHNKPSIPEPELVVEADGVPAMVSEPILDKLVPPTDFDIFDAVSDPTGKIAEQPSTSSLQPNAELHDESVGAALDQISFLNTSLDASAIEQSILEKVKFIDDLEPHNVSVYARYPDAAQCGEQFTERSYRDVDASRQKVRDGISMVGATGRTLAGVSEHAAQSSTVNFGDLSNIILSSEDIGILSKIITTLTPVNTLLTPTTVSTAVTKSSPHEQIETSESWAIVDANLSSSFPDISPLKMFIDRNALSISSDNDISGTTLINKISLLPSPTATDRPPSYGECTPTTIEHDHGDANDHNYHAGARDDFLPCGETDNHNVSVGTSKEPNDSIENVPEIDSSKDPNDSTENAPEIDSSLMSGVKSESGSTQKINIDNEYAIKNLVSLSQSSSDANDFSSPNSSEVDFLIGLLDTIYLAGNGDNKDSDKQRDVDTWDHLTAGENPEREGLVENQQRSIDEPVRSVKAVDTETVSTIKVSEESTVPEEREKVAKKPVIASSTPVGAPKIEAVAKKTKLLILPSGRSPVLAPPKRKPVTTVTVHRQKQSTNLGVKTKVPADGTGDNLILLTTMPPIDSDKPKSVTKPTPVTPKETKTVEKKQTLTAKHAGVDLILLPTMQPMISDKSSKTLASNKNTRKSETDVDGNANKKPKISDITTTTTPANTSLQHPEVVLNIFDKIKLEKRAACTRKSPTLANVRNPDNPSANRSSPKSKIRLPDIRAHEKYISKNPSPPELVAKEAPPKQVKRDNYIIINTDNLLKLKMKPVHRSFQSCRTDSAHNLKRNSPVLGEPTSKLRRVEGMNKGNVFDGALQQGDVNAVLRLKLAEEVAPRPVHQKRASYGGKHATQYRSGLSSNGYKVDKWYQKQKEESSDSSDESASPKRRSSSEGISGTSSPYQTHRSTGPIKSTTLKRRPHDEPVPTSRLFFPSSSSNVLRTYYKPGVSRSSHLSEDP